MGHVVTQAFATAYPTFVRLILFEFGHVAQRDTGSTLLAWHPVAPMLGRSSETRAATIFRKRAAKRVGMSKRQQITPTRPSDTRKSTVSAIVGLCSSGNYTND
jgi:hypothetical protein